MTSKSVPTSKSAPVDAFAFVLATGAAFGLAGLPAQADVTLQGQQAVGVGQSAPVSAAVRLFLQGANARLETSGEPALVYDGKANILYGVNTARRSYYLTVPAPLDPTEEISLNADEVKIDTKFDLHRTVLAQTIAGQATHQYLVSGSVTYTRLPPARIEAQNDQDAEQEREGRRRRSAAFVAPQWRIQGEVWLADTRKFPAEEDILLAAQLTAVSAGPFEQPLADALDKHGGLPLLARVVVTHVPARRNALPVVTETSWSVKSVSEAPLPPTLFQAPLEYALVAAPLTPYTPGQFSPAP